MLFQLLKIIYSKIPCKKQIFVLLKFIFKPGKNIYKHLHFKGIFTVRITQQEGFKIRHYGYELENELFWTGIDNGWERQSMKLWIQLSKNAETIIDIGANTGIYSLVSKTVNKNADVHAFEPIKTIYDKLVLNGSINNYDIKCNLLALSNQNGKAKIFLPDSEHVYSVTVNKNMNPQNKKTVEQNIDTITLAEYIKLNNIKKIDLMKIDVETHEYEVLQGMGKYLEMMQPTMLVEILDDEIGKKIQSLLKNCKYIFFDIDEENEHISLTDNIQKSTSFNYLICNRDIALQLNLIKGN